MMVTGMLAGPIYDAGYFRALLLVGSFMLVFGHMMLSLCHAYWQVLLSQAFCVGIGAGLIYVPSVAILSTYFSTKIGTAIGIAASGSSLGGVIYPIVFHKLLPKIGFSWTTRVLGFIMLATMVVPNIFMRVRVLPAKKRSLFDLQAFTIPAYSLLTFGFFLGFMGLNMPFFYAQVYAIKERITNEDLAFYLLAILNSTSTFGRKSTLLTTCIIWLTRSSGILPNILADKIGPFNVVIPCMLISATLCLLFITVTAPAGIIILMAFYGFFSGTFVSLPSTIVIYLSGNARDKIGTRLGQAFSLIAFGVLIGAPIGGSILSNHGFDALWIYGGCMLFGSSAIVLASKFSWEGIAIRKRA
jgi:MFS family permease